MGEDVGETSPRLPGEGRRPLIFTTQPSSTAEVIKEKKLTFEEASRCLNTLGKDETGSRYAYLRITAADRKLTDVSTILSFKHVLFLDLSGNYLTTDALQVLTAMPFLVFLKAERNKVESAKLQPMFYLQILDLNQNQIRDVEDIKQPLLDCLDLSFNDIYSAHFDSAILENLKQLELRSNLLFEIGGVYPENLEKLYMAANKITTVTAPDLAKLEILHLRENNLRILDGFSENMRKLRYLNLRNNKIDRFKEFRKLQCLPNLETLVVTGNPLPGAEAGGGEGGEGGSGRDPAVIPLLVLLPKLKRINKTVVTVEHRIEAEDLENDVLENLIGDGSAGRESDRETTTSGPGSDYREEADA